LSFGCLQQLNGGNRMIDFLTLVIAYFVILLIIGLYARKKTSRSVEDYFVAGRTFGPVILFFTMAATNFSAFTFLGFAGKSYQSGFGQYGIMAFGTGFMALTFYIIGRKVWILGKKRKYITPGELVGSEMNSTSLRLLFMGVMVVFTIPYLATQAIGAGFLISYVTSGQLIWTVGATITMIIILFYVLLGGMKGSGWTDALQGCIMILSLVIAVVFIAMNLGGFETAGRLAYAKDPVLFLRPGGGDYFTPQIWFSFLLLWFFADPMFPQLFSRFYTAKDQRSLRASMILYPLLVSFLFLIPVLIGIWAHGVSLSVSSSNIDMVLPMMVQQYTPPFVFFFVMIGALAALMSTADSQLLSLSTMLSRDVFKKKKGISEIALGRVIAVLLTFFAILFVVLGYDPSVGIMGTLVKTTFPGLAVLFPTVIGVLYWKKVTKYGCVASILFGELSVFLIEYQVVPSFGILSGIWGVGVAVIILIIGSLVYPVKREISS
jgi:solute:Na+ symporter, SSS family